ncbi:sodium/hydrogen exchanger family protein [Lysobacter antibioticus]|uniref:cation:proton antiporter n=1 Tax=Lysobacter antibioticus TaxID=84531 RepID=UPI0007171719|nr:cation:proton antiporter [Lysobacter antibioticus]ALN62389.1 sodium/hydrogen exchanger family protein [Lysobacter antibioticus]
MQAILAALVDSSIFILLSWGIWRLLGRSIPLAVVPIAIGLGLAAVGGLPAQVGVPSAIGDQFGWVGVLALAFTAGLETRHGGDPAMPSPAAPGALGSSLPRFVLSAALALALPFLVGTVAAHAYFTGLPGWAPPRGQDWLGAVAIGLCVAVSALPVLIGIVRELKAEHRALTQVAVGIAVVDDAVLWVGLAALLLIADGGAGFAGWSGLDALAVVVPLVLAAAAALAERKAWVPPTTAIWLAMPLYLGACSSASSQLGLHALLGAYFGGAIMAPGWIRRLPVERIGQLALVGLAPLFFGHSGLRIDGDALGWSSLQATVALLALSVAAKLAALLVCPPSATFSRRDALAIGALLQCKGLMEIVAATVLRDKGLLSEPAYAALVMLAVLSTVLTGPLFRSIVGRRSAAPDADRKYV